MQDLHVVLRHRGRRSRSIDVLIALTVGLAMITGAPSVIARTAAGTTTGSPGVFAINQDLHTVIFAPGAGGPIRPVMSGLMNPPQIVVSRGGSLFIIDGPRLLKITPRGIILTIRSGMAANSTIAVDNDNWLFVHHGVQVFKYSPPDGSSPVAVGGGRVR
ncbi:hypothetical protein ABIB25_005695 [Nakamurella sp. UYEF19]|uniref:hypothetical protein n=1 Tax=Nakamurella sp. UYEF19 TaxID=1756392 RepID=UPI003393F1C7